MTEVQPIFDVDIPCPHCEYNLRGLVEPLCPECGNTFEPHNVLMAYRDGQPSLSLPWVLRNMYRHPLSFWQLREVRFSCGPTRTQIFELIWASIFLVIVLGFILKAVIDGLGQSVFDDGVVLMSLLGAIITSFGASLGVYVLCLLHGSLCRLGLMLGRQREGVRAAKEIVGYGLVWLGPLLLTSVLGLFFLAPNGSPVAQGAAIVLFCAAAITCILWTITLYRGGRFASGGNRWIGVWCALGNLTLYVWGLILLKYFG